jgi:hypothetical protein
VSTMRDRIYQTSDLSGAARREFIEQARNGQARLRTPEGDALVMLRQANLEHLSAMRDYAIGYLMLDNAMSRTRDERRPADFGDWAFLHAFDDDDLAEFQVEINASLVLTASGQDVAVVETTLDAWRRSARTLQDPVALSILSGEVDPDEWLDLDRPED